MAGVRLTTSQEVIQNKDRILAAISYTGRIKMPPTGQLNAEDMSALREWIQSGAPWSPAAATKPGSGWWAFQKPVRPLVPAINDTWARNEIDRFVLTAMRQKGLAPAPEADRATLIRRATYTLHGLPPTYLEIQDFLNDSRPDAYSRLIERLLASERYGEKWAKHWLDLVRYGDTSGFEQDPYLLYAWRYRDYVIQSFNADKPYDRFVKEQIAGDELYPDEPTAQQGTGYFTVGTNRDMLFKVEDVNKVETLTDWVDTTSAVFLGLSAGCARCHDHKFDPIPQRDYYRLQAVFANTVKSRVFLNYDQSRIFDLQENTRNFRLFETGAQLIALLDPHRTSIRNDRLEKLGKEAVAAFATPDDKKTPQQRALYEMHAKKVEPTDDEVYARLSAKELEKLHQIERRLVSMYKTFAPGPFAPSATDSGPAGRPTYVPAKGSAVGEEVRAGFFSALGGGDAPEPPPGAETTMRRKALAEWIASKDNPLTARVMVNRIWQYHFGRAIVATANDFGSRSTPPSHPELLEWLATEFGSRNWSIKDMHRLILNSATFRQAAAPSVKAGEIDPENTLLSHFSRRRLEAEEIRDSILQASGVLNLKTGGRPVVPALETEELYGMSQPLANAWVVSDDPNEHDRRTIYMISRRNFRMPLLEVFDRPEGVLTCPRRESSTTAPQSLSLLNGAFTMSRARRLAAKLEKAADAVTGAWREVFGRNPNDSEAQSARQFLQKQTAQLPTPLAALTELSRALMNSNEFLYVD